LITSFDASFLLSGTVKLRINARSQIQATCTNEGWAAEGFCLKFYGKASRHRVESGVFGATMHYRFRPSVCLSVSLFIHLLCMALNSKTKRRSEIWC